MRPWTRPTRPHDVRPAPLGKRACSRCGHACHAESHHADGRREEQKGWRRDACTRRAAAATAPPITGAPRARCRQRQGDGQQRSLKGCGRGNANKASIGCTRKGSRAFLVARENGRAHHFTNCEVCLSRERVKAGAEKKSRPARCASAANADQATAQARARNAQRSSTCQPCISSSGTGPRFATKYGGGFRRRIVPVPVRLNSPARAQTNG